MNEICQSSSKKFKNASTRFHVLVDQKPKAKTKSKIQNPNGSMEGNDGKKMKWIKRTDTETNYPIFVSSSDHSKQSSLTKLRKQKQRQK